MMQALPESWRRRISEYFRGSENSTLTSSDDQSLSVTVRNDAVVNDASSVQLADLSFRDPSGFVPFNDEGYQQDATRTPAGQSKLEDDARLSVSTVVDVRDAWSSIVTPSTISAGQAAATVTTVQRGQVLASNLSSPSNSISHLGLAVQENADAAFEELRAELLALKDVLQQQELVIQQNKFVIQQKDQEIRRLQKQSD